MTTSRLVFRLRRQSAPCDSEKMSGFPGMNDKVRLGKSPRFALAGHDNGASRRTLVLWCRCKAADCSHDGSYAFHPMSIKEYERRDQTTNDTRGWPWKTSVLYVSEHG